VTRFPPQRLAARPQAVHRPPARPAVPGVRELWLTGTDLDRARDVVRVTDTGRQLLADEPAPHRRLAARVDWGAVVAVSSVVVLAVVIALALTGGYQ
jgi:hypothetical protein